MSALKKKTKTNLKNNLYCFCRKSNEHCLLIDPKCHGTCGFALRPGAATPRSGPLPRVGAGAGRTAGLPPAWVSFIAAELSALHFLMT